MPPRCSPRRRARRGRRSNSCAVGSSGSPRSTSTSTAWTWSNLERGGAAGGLAGGLAAVGATLEDGFTLIAEAVDLYDAIESADLVVTGEGRLDATSFEGKVVGGVAALAAAAGVDAVAIVGRADDGVDSPDPGGRSASPFR